MFQSEMIRSVFKNLLLAVFAIGLGAWVFTAKADLYELTSDTSGRRPSTLVFDTQRTGSDPSSFEETTFFSGTVVDQNRPVSNALVLLSGSNELGLPQFFRARTNLVGHFEFPYLNLDKFRTLELKVSGSGYESVGVSFLSLKTKSYLHIKINLQQGLVSKVLKHRPSASNRTKIIVRDSNGERVGPGRIDLIPNRETLYNDDGHNDDGPNDDEQRSLASGKSSHPFSRKGKVKISRDDAADTDYGDSLAVGVKLQGEVGYRGGIFGDEEGELFALPRGRSVLELRVPAKEQEGFIEVLLDRPKLKPPY